MALKERVLVEEEYLQGRGESQEREAPHGEFVRKMSDLAGEETCRWLRNSFLKTRTEGKAMQRPGVED